jgi:transcriptional regulator with XRE-family HTH domain
VRRDRFAKFVTRALDDARGQGRTIAEIEELTGVSKSTFYRWANGEWTKDPSGIQVRGFCEGLGIPVTIANDLLGWSGDARQPAPEMPLEPDIQQIIRTLRDPQVPDREKNAIREMIRLIARRRPNGGEEVAS